MKLTIDRTKWLRGQPADSVLLNTEGKMCCLGFEAIELHNYTKEEILSVGCPNGVRDITRMADLIDNETLSSRYPENSVVCCKLMKINDMRVNGSIWTEQDREKELTTVFATRGIEVEFIN